jgi:hypothetical protein
MLPRLGSAELQGEVGHTRATAREPYLDAAQAIWNASKPLENPDTLIAMWFDV